MDYREINKITYNKYAEEFEKKSKNYIIDGNINNEISLFIENLSGKNILDLGSGPGRDSAFFKKKGLNPLCLDISEEMIKLCKSKGLETKLGDIENLKFKDESFDGVWAHTSLLHVPKNKFSNVLKKIDKILKPRGIFFITMKQGEYEGMIQSPSYPNSERFFALYSDSELKEILSKQFNLLYSSEVRLGEAVFMNYLCNKKNHSQITKY